MKLTSKTLSFLILVVVASVYTGCKKENNDKKTLEQTQFEKLKGVWTVVSANDGSDRTAEFTDPDAMKLTLEGNYAEGGLYNYSLTGARPNPSPWPASGTWKFGTNKASEIIRDPDSTSEIQIGYSVTDTDLIMTFTVPEGSPGWPGSRVNSVSGEWTFTFTK